MHSAINGFLGHLSPSAMGNMITVMNALGIDKFLSAYGDMDRPSLILKRFFLRGFAR